MARSFHGMGWDEVSSESEKERWITVWHQYPELSGEDLLVPRCVLPIAAVDRTDVEFFGVFRMLLNTGWCGYLC